MVEINMSYNPKLYKWNYLVLQILIFVITNSSFYTWRSRKSVARGTHINPKSLRQRLKCMYHFLGKFLTINGKQASTLLPLLSNQRGEEIPRSLKKQKQKTLQRILALCDFWENDRINKIKSALGKFLVMVLKNRSNEIRINEIRIRRELPVLTYTQAWRKV